MSALTPIKTAGLDALVAPNGGLRLRGLASLTTEQKSQVVEYARTHKAEILTALMQSGHPGECESCPAAGYWDHSHYAGQGLLCFYSAYYLGKPGKPKPCKRTRSMCPRQMHPVK